ncbi:hypothetical protein RRG08_034795 [Elysia crispata]|uniref:Uncharacterized protein n=1 Tax=Elysia crispata TaxID=231223 RepID=A0AAE0YA72_9GAST|nr:hypothetical protein RRG08_034795 [Elysia crispata]
MDMSSYPRPHPNINEQKYPLDDYRNRRQKSKFKDLHYTEKKNSFEYTPSTLDQRVCCWSGKDNRHINLQQSEAGGATSQLAEPERTATKNPLAVPGRATARSTGDLRL